VNLKPATTYDIVLTLEGTDLRAECRGTTWSETFPVESTVKVSNRNTTLTVNQSGSPEAYVLFDGTDCTIDTGNKEKVGIAVDASYVILQGFPGADSDIYCNYIANCWDDGIEAEGGDQNVRIWNNYIEDVLIPIANAAVSIGPLYVWRNVSGRSYSPPGSSWDMTHGPMIKMGYANGEKWMTGHMYFFNNTIFQEDSKGANGLGGSGRIIKHCTTRNNILHVRREDRYSIAVNGSHEGNDFDYDLISAAFPPNTKNTV